MYFAGCVIVDCFVCLGFIFSLFLFPGLCDALEYLSVVIALLTNDNSVPSALSSTSVHK